MSEPEEPSAREAFYDAEIAPVLMKLAAACEAKGLSFLAVVEWAPDELGRTVTISPPSGAGIRMANAAAASRGNLDSLAFSVARDIAPGTPHNSIVLKMLGVDPDPSARAR